MKYAINIITYQVVNYVKFVVSSISGIDLFVHFFSHVFLQYMSVLEQLLTVQTIQPAAMYKRCAYHSIYKYIYIITIYNLMY